MKNYFIHSSKNKYFFQVYEYLDDESSIFSEITMEQLDHLIEPNSLVNYFLPSNQCIALKGKKNQSETDEQFKARFLMENEHELIDEISRYSFSYFKEMELVILVDNSLIDPISDLLGQLGCDIRIIPEHNLLHAYSNDSCMDYMDRYIFSFSDGSGFSTNESNIQSYLALLKQQIPDYNPQCLTSNRILLDAFSKSNNEEKVNLRDLHRHFMNVKKSEFPNLFQGHLSLKSIYRRLDLSTIQILLSSFLILSFILFPIININIMKNYQKRYEQNTLDIFIQLSPNFRRVINSKMQMDELLMAMDQNKVVVLDLSAMQYLRTISLNKIVRSRVDYDQSIFSIELNQLSRIKYKILEELIKSSELNIINNQMVLDDGFVSGSLVLELNSE